ncbi:MAG: glycosyltransferase family 2 protein [Vicingaceae bacterium]
MKTKSTLKVSIITVCYNSAKTIEDTIQSVLTQGYKSIEYLIVDGQSTDGTLAILEKFKDQLQYISESDKGMYDGLNKGIKKANGDIIGILNADDFYIDNKVIEDVVELMTIENTDALYADLYYVDAENTNQVKRYWKSGNYKHGDFKKGWMPPHPAFFLKKECYEKYGNFNLSLKTAADYELMLRMLHKYKVPVSYLKRVIVKMRIGGMSNASFKNRWKANRQDKKAWEINGLKPAPYTFLFKPMRKIVQFLKTRG